MPTRRDLEEGVPRRGFLARMAAALVGASGAAAVVRAATAGPADAGYFTFCGHTWTTGACPHPTGLPRIDLHGFPLRAQDGHPVDDLGRPIDRQGNPLDPNGNLLRGPDGKPLPPATRSRVCKDAVAHRFHLDSANGGTWHRCCHGHVRKLVDCCAHTQTRINGDQALVGYCHGGRNVFCVQYYDTRIPC